MGNQTLPEFTEDGLLPPGDYVLTLAELAQSSLVAGPADAERYPQWDAAWRATLVENLEAMVRQPRGIVKIGGMS